MLTVLYKDKDIVVVIKPVGLLSEEGDGSLPALLREELSLGEIYPIHRLDRTVGGVMVYALSKKSAAALSLSVQNGDMKKRYLAIVHGRPVADNGVFEDLLFKDSRKNKSFVVTRERKGVKKASLRYEVLKSDGERSLVKILLHTGRSHQIRVQFSSRKMPLVGDGKYGATDNEKNICLFSHSLTFPHPRSGEEVEFSALPDWDRL
jgi:23S rRNA pseudouridine1911/1915/1917 synthase